jgi:hypothetical protein
MSITTCLQKLPHFSAAEQAAAQSGGITYIKAQMDAAIRERNRLRQQAAGNQVFAGGRWQTGEVATSMAQGRDSFTPDAYDAKEFAKTVDTVLSAKETPRHFIRMGDTPAVLRALGARAPQMQIQASVIRKANDPAIKGHDVPASVLRNLPALLANPIAVFDSRTEEGALLAFVEAKDDSGRDVAIAVHLNTKGAGFAEINKIASVYGREENSAKEFSKWANDGALRYYHTEKAARLLHGAKLQLPGANTIKRLNPNAITESDIVNGDGINFSIAAANPAATSAATQQSSNWSVAPPKTKLAQMMDEVIYQFQDKYKDLKAIIKAIEDFGGTVRDVFNPYIAETLMHGRVAEFSKQFMEREIKPILSELEKAGITMTQFENFLHARHAVERNKAMRDRNPTQAEIDARLLRRVFACAGVIFPAASASRISFMRASSATVTLSLESRSISTRMSRPHWNTSSTTRCSASLRAS